MKLILEFNVSCDLGPEALRLRPACLRAMPFMLLVLGFLLRSNECLGEVDYLREIKPLLKTKCWACHGPLKQESGLRLDAGSLLLKGGESGPAIVREHAEQSLLIERISETDKSLRMPPEGEPLTSQQVKLIAEWVQSGARFPDDELSQIDPRDHWSFQPLQKIELKAAAENQNPIDQFVEQKLNEAGLQFSQQADSLTLIRRLYLDMHGLPPTWEQVQEFSSDPGPEQFSRLIDQVLASPRYGERWGQHWLDIVRYADTHGYEVNTPRPNAWPYRDYVIAALNDDKPYDQFVREQLVGDLSQQDAATGFLVAAAVLLPGQIGKDEPSIRLARQDSLDEMVVGTSATFLGVTLGCARCHDHKFDPFTAHDYYSMQAFFAGVDYGDREVRDAEFDERLREADSLQPRLDELRAELRKYETPAFTGTTILIDDEDTQYVTLLKEKQGHGENPSGGQRGYRDDPGTGTRMPNLSQGRYTWWVNQPGEDVLSYRPGVEGDFEIWISWGAHGSGVHTRDARYVLDLDGDRTTVTDQKELAQIDQYYVAGRKAGETAQKPLWSGLQNIGIHHLLAQSQILVRGGETGTGISADVIVLQECPAETKYTQKFPRLRMPVNFQKNLESFAPVRADKVRFTSFETTNKDRYEPCLDELEVFEAGDLVKNVALASAGTRATSSGDLSKTGRHQLQHIHDGLYGNDKSWISNQKGQGWVQLEFPEPVLIDRIVWGRDRDGKLEDRLPVRYHIQVSHQDGEWVTVAQSSDRLPWGTNSDLESTLIRNAPAEIASDLRTTTEELAKLEKKQSDLKQPKLVYAGQFRTPDPTHLLRRGDPEQPAEEVASAPPAIFLESDVLAYPSEQSRRQGLADWLTRPENPLTARVMVNRVWQYHFGTGIVETPSDLGLNGARPSHPELLDWLAAEFIQNNWSLKHLHRLILTSRTWQQGHGIDPNATRIDGDCRLLWRFPMRRLEAEVIRDSLLQVSGNLNLTMGGPGFDFFRSRGGLSGFPPVTEFNENSLRRMIYAHKIRMESVPTFGAFDCPDAGQPAPTRSRSTTAIQALNLFNSHFVAQQSLAMAEKIVNETPVLEDQVRVGYRNTFTREPSASELAAASAVVHAHGLPTLIRVLFNSNEFLMLP